MRVVGLSFSGGCAHPEGPDSDPPPSDAKQHWRSYNLHTPMGKLSSKPAFFARAWQQPRAEESKRGNEVLTIVVEADRKKSLYQAFNRALIAPPPGFK